jgi:putative membrane protein
MSVALFEYDGVLRSIVASPVGLPVIPGGLTTLAVILVLFSVWHAACTLGARLTVAFFAITAVTSWIFEEVGVATGLVYGPYHYTAALGPWLGSVPILIPLAWFMMIYVSYVAANLILDRRAVGTPGTRAHLVGLGLLGAIVITAWDLLADPILSGPTVRAWVWEQGGPYFGVPIQNYLGWVVTAFVIFALYRSLERRWEPRPANPLIAGGVPAGT